MFNPLQSTTVGALEKTIAFTERRHQVLAGNLANMSTPDYRSRDLDVDAFQSALAESIQAKQRTPSPEAESVLTGFSPAELFQQHVARMQSASPALASAGLIGQPTVAHTDASGQADHPKTHTRDDVEFGPRDAMEGIVYHDNSDISIEQEVTRIAKNKHLHNVAIATMRSQFDLMRAAITERA